MSEAEFDFEAALEAKFAALSQEEGTPAEAEQQDSVEEEVPADAGIEAEAEGEEVQAEEDEQPRDDKGRFLPKFNDPDVQSFVEKHGGDLQKALKSAAHQESLVGRLGNEVGELRRMVEQRPQAQQPQYVPPAPDPDEDPSGAAIWALETNNQSLYERALENWYDEDPRSASRFEMARMAELMEAKFAQQTQPVVQTVQSQAQAQAVARAQSELAGRYEDFSEIIGTASADELQGFPQQTLEQIKTGDLAAKTAALEAVYRWVKAGRPPEPPKKETPPKPTKADTAVVTASSQPVREAKSGVQEFKNFLLAPDPTSTVAGRTHE